jgi:UDP-N-acetylglucosamine 1-carboxyvinyltransferase
MLAAVLAHGDTVLENAAREPEIADLANCLIKMGAKIEGAGTGTIRITGVTSLKAAEHRVMADRIEAGTYALAAAATSGSDVTLTGIDEHPMAALIDAMRKAGVEVSAEGDKIRVRRNGGRLKAVDIDTQPFPGFPTDLQAQFMALMTLADGASVIRETIFENRFMHAPELMRLGADISIRGNEAVVRGVDRLVAAPVMATDLRASVSLVIAGLAAEGTTRVARIYHLDRGFERLDSKLAGVGAHVTREPDR